MLLVIQSNGDCYTTDISDSNHFEDALLRIEKYEDKIWTAVYWDSELEFHYLKRFSIDVNQKMESLIGGAQNKLLFLTDTQRPQLVISKEEAPEKGQTTIIEVEDFIGVKSIKAKGKRVASYPVKFIAELPSANNIEETDINDIEEFDEEDLSAQEQLFDLD